MCSLFVNYVLLYDNNNNNDDNINKQHAAVSHATK